MTRACYLVLLSAFFVNSSFAQKAIPLQKSLQKFVTFHSFDAPEAPAVVRQAPAAGAGLPAVLSPKGVRWEAVPYGGLIRTDPKAAPADRVQYFASRRYLPDDEVTAIAIDGDGAWVRTKTGISHIEMRLMSLEEKTKHFEERISARHDRWGMVADSRLRVPGDLTTNLMVSNDNDGLWTAMYAAAECFRYSVTKSDDALRRAKRATEAVLYLTDVTGRKGFLARSYIKQGEPKPKDGFWYKTADGAIEWKADTSSDEIVGHFLIFALAYDLIPDQALKARIQKTARDIIDHILENKLYLIDVTGKPTRWGRWSPEYFASETGRPDAPLNAIELLMFLKVAHHVTGDARYQSEYNRVAWDMGYAQLGTRYLELQEELNYSDEELAMLSFYPLFLYEKDAKLLKLYREALEQWWKNEQRELSPLWTFIYVVANPSAKVDMDGAIWTLHRMPNDLVAWAIKNSHRPGITKVDAPDRHGRGEITTLLPADERPVMKWNGNPFVADGGNGGHSEDDGAAFLLPYWMGRYHKLIVERGR